VNGGEAMNAMRLPLELERHASLFADIALANIVRQYPNKLDHVIEGPADMRSPQELHPLFYGSYDWHSAVHMHWLLARLLRLCPKLPEAPQIRQVFNLHFTADKVATETAYLHRPSSQSFERTYGWAWLLKLQTELMLLAKADSSAAKWRDALAPLANLLAERYLQFLPLAQFPIRAGTHANSAFGMLFALDYAETIQHIALRKLIIRKANAWFGRDRRYPAAYEPGGDDFLPGGLIEAALMLRVVDACSYADWWQIFCPVRQDLQIWLSPVSVTDRSDPKLAHLDGLNLSRAWCWKLLEKELPASLQAPVNAAIDVHIEASLPYALRGNYAGTHWLASFALLALTGN
jgi:hypothetical protein